MFKICYFISFIFFFSIPSHFTIELSGEAFELFSKYVASSYHTVLQQLLNTTLEISIISIKVENPTSDASPKPNNVSRLVL